MLRIWFTVTLLLLNKGGDIEVTCQSVNFPDVQSFLNFFCTPGSFNKGCSNSSIVEFPGGGFGGFGGGRPRPRPTTAPPFNPAPSGCLSNEKRCPQLRNKCVPFDFDCNLLNAGIKCTIPEEYGTGTQVLICGDDTPVGTRCGIGNQVPLLTVLLVQCQGSSVEELEPVTSLDVLVGPDGEGGAGIYQCSPTTAWEPRLGSPFIKQLTDSCRNAGCGRLPQPSDKLRVHRQWSWVRGIYKGGNLHCTGTLVSPNAIVTAAHCVTSSPVSHQADPNLDEYAIELPGPNEDAASIRRTPESIHIHPRYRFNNGKYQHDLAIMTFKVNGQTSLPYACVSDRPYTQEIGKSQVVFNLEDESEFSGRLTSGPSWKFLKATWDGSCVTTSTRFEGGCSNTLQVQQSQFCASHRGSSLSKGSSGGPYLAEVGNNLEEIWVLMGILSLNSEPTDGQSCSREHSVYGQVADESQWINECVFEGRCRN